MGEETSAKLSCELVRKRLTGDEAVAGTARVNSPEGDGNIESCHGRLERARRLTPACLRRHTPHPRWLTIPLRRGNLHTNRSVCQFGRLRAKPWQIIIEAMTRGHVSWTRQRNSLRRLGTTPPASTRSALQQV